MRIQMHGGDFTALGARITAKAVAVEAVTHEGLTQAVEILTKGIQSELTRRSHAEGTATPAAPGEPPAKVSEALARSVKSGGVHGSAGVYEATVGATTVYARIQELGGRTGRGHAVTLPRRPYLHAGLRRVQAQMLAVLIAAWRRAMGA